MAAGPRRFFFIRHGETDWNREGRLQGQRDVALNPLGRRQAAAAGAVLERLLASRGLRADERDWVASPLARTRATLELARGALGLPPELYRCDDRLKELSFGRWEGRSWTELKATLPGAVAARRRDPWGYVPPEGESYAMLLERVMPWLAEAVPDTVVVAHGGVARVLLHRVAGLAVERAVTQDIHQGRALVFDGGAARWA